MDTVNDYLSRVAEVSTLAREEQKKSERLSAILDETQEHICDIFEDALSNPGSEAQLQRLKAVQREVQKRFLAQDCSDAARHEYFKIVRQAFITAIQALKSTFLDITTQTFPQLQATQDLGFPMLGVSDLEARTTLGEILVVEGLATMATTETVPRMLKTIMSQRMQVALDLDTDGEATVCDQTSSTELVSAARARLMDDMDNLCHLASGEVRRRMGVGMEIAKEGELDAATYLFGDRVIGEFLSTHTRDTPPDVRH